MWVAPPASNLLLRGQPKMCASLRQFVLLSMVVSLGPACSDGASSERGSRPTDARPLQSSLPLAATWTAAWGGEFGDGASDVAVSAEAIYVVGSFVGTVDLDPSDGSVSETTSSASGVTGSGRTFVSKFTLDGGFVWTRTLPGPRVNHSPAVALAPSGNVLVAGGFDGSDDFDPGPGEDLHEAPMGGGYFVAAFDDAGTYLYSRSWAASSPQVSEAEVELESDGDAVYLLAKLVPDGGSPGGSALVRLEPSDGSELWAVGLSGNSASGLAVSAGRVAATIVNPPAIALFDDAGNAVTSPAWQGYGEPHALGFASDGGLVLGGLVHEPYDGGMLDLDPTAGEDLRVSFGNDDAFVVGLDADGNYRFGQLFGGVGGDGVRRLASLPDGSLLASGTFRRSVDFAFGAGDVREARGVDAFVLELTATGTPQGALTFGSDGDDAPPVFAPLASGLVLAGTFADSLNLALSCAGVTQVSSGYGDCYLAAFGAADVSASSVNETCGDAPPEGLPRNQTDARLGGTNLPKNFDDCVAQGGGVWSLQSGDQVCAFVIAQSDDPALYEECTSVGGGISVADGDTASYYCDISYPEYGPLCFGNYCD